MEAEYDVFLPANSGHKARIPYTITIMKANGSFSTHNITVKGQLETLRPYAAYKIHKPVDPREELGEDLCKQGFVSRFDAKRIITYLENRGLLKFTATTSKDWLDEKMDELNIRYSTQRTNLRNWFENPEQYKEVNFDIKNRILTVKPVCGGRVVVLPTGHTIAYTTARAVYNEFVGKPDYTKVYNRRIITVGEFNGYNVRYTKHRLTMNHDTVSVGCQVVPREAILELAKREGW